MFVVLVTRGTDAERELADLLHEQAEFALGVTPTLAEAEALIAGTPESAVLLPITGPDDPVLDGIAAAVGRGAHIGAVLAADADSMRTTVFAFGAHEALVAPFDRARVSAALATLVGRPVRRFQRCEVPFTALVAAPGLPATNATVVNLSRGGVALKCERALPVGGVVRLAIQTPAPYHLPVLFARTIATETVTLGQVTRAAFVGMTAEEQGQVEAFVASLGPEVEDVGAALAAVRGLSLDRLRRGLAAGVRLPALVPLERAALEGQAVSDLCAVAVARCRALLLSSAVDAARATEQPVPANLPFAAWWKEISDARAIVEILLERAEKNGRADEAKALRELLARVIAAATGLDRTSLQVTGRSYARQDALEAPVSGDTVTSLPTVTEADLAGGAVEDGGTADRLGAIAEQAVAKDEAAKAASQRKPLPRWATAAIGVGVALVGAIAVRLWLGGGKRLDPPVTVTADRPIAVSGPVRVRALYRQDGSTMVAIVDGAWFDASDAQQESAFADLSHRYVHPPQVTRLEIHDYGGRLLRASDDPAPDASGVPAATAGATP